jgi:formate-dependent nitrite reductase membrane component NrfD
VSNKPFKQSDLSFAVGPKFQTVWGLREAIVFMLEGVGVSSFFWFAFSDNVMGMACALTAVGVAVALLLSHLGRPSVAWRAITNIRRSWISRGTAAIGLFFVLAATHIGSLVIPGVEFVQNLSSPLLLILFFAGIFILLYPGFAMRASAGIAFWLNPNHLSLSFLNGFSSGMIVYLAVASAIQPQETVGLMGDLCTILLLVTVISTLILTHQSLQRDGAAALSMRTLIRHEPVLFWLLALGLGLVAPLIIIGFDIAGPGSIALALVAVGRIIGDIAFRYAILKVGAFESVL